VRIADAARARCIALFTDAGVVSRMSATSAALNPSPSRRISTARYQYCTLGDGQVLQRGDEGQLDALPLQVRRRRIRLVIDKAHHRARCSVTQPASAMGPSCDR